MLKKLVLVALVAASAVFAQINVSGRVAFNYGNVWGENTDEMDWGAGFIIGPEVRYNINPMISIISGLELDYRRVSYEYHVDYDRYLDPDLKNYDVTETTSFMYLDIPLLLRIKPVSFFYVEAGMNFDFNLSANNVLEYDDESISDDVSASVKTFEYALVCGLGFEVVTDLELNFRALFGMTSLSKNVNDIKHLRLQAGLTYWTF